MRKLLIGGVAAMTVLAAPARAQTTPEFDAKTKAATDYVAGTLKLDLPKITYSGPPIELKYSSFVSKAAYPWGPWGKAIEQLTAETNGKLVIKIFAGGVLHAAKDGFKAVRDGIADISHCYVSYQPTSFKLMHASGLAGLYPDGIVGAAVAMELYPKYFKKEYEAVGVYLMRSSVTPPYNIVSKEPIKTLEDLKGKKLRTTGGIQGDLAKAVGAIPVFLSAAEQYTAFQRGTVDGVVGHDGAHIIFRSAEPAKHWINTRFSTVDTQYCINRKTFDALPADLKQHLYGWAQRWNMVDANLWYEGFAAQAREKMKGMGIAMNQIDPAERKKILDAMGKVEESWVASMEKEGQPAKALLADVRRLVAQYEKMSWNDIFIKVAKSPVKGVIDF